MKKIVLDRGMNYGKGTEELEADGVEICITAGYIFEEH